MSLSSSTESRWALQLTIPGGQPSTLHSSGHSSTLHPGGDSSTLHPDGHLSSLYPGGHSSTLHSRGHSSKLHPGGQLSSLRWSISSRISSYKEEILLCSQPTSGHLNHTITLLWASRLTASLRAHQIASLQPPLVSLHPSEICLEAISLY